ncbi:hypothetical protein PIB30_094191 [Stylosanthes scabra]|uniref:Zinc finger GRF-type domain-containing protein n=1 Tax=Stylosanthes scabra TaxID=79078 RepID=A0ABU6YSY0_9FABA|nr:hypothetical protein [Stylosanthes scabra]
MKFADVSVNAADLAVTAQRWTNESRLKNNQPCKAKECHQGLDEALVVGDRRGKLYSKLFFGCPFFKAGLPHCKLFVWLDRHTAKLTKKTGEFAEEKEDVNEHFSKIGMENRFADIENRVAAIEKNRKLLNPWLIVGLLLGFIAIYVTGLGRVYG